MAAGVGREPMARQRGGTTRTRQPAVAAGGRDKHAGGTKGGRSRCWCGTLNNPEPGDYENLLEFAQTNGFGLVVGKETGKGGTPHLQLFCGLPHPRSLKGVISLWRTTTKTPGAIHWEEM